MTSNQQPSLIEQEQAPQTLLTPKPDTEQSFNWRNCWYPVAFIQDLPKDRPYSFSLYDEPLVLFRNKHGQYGCVIDRCSHRAARLSDGQIIDGKLECLYHGWQFGIDGQCLYIPQLPTDAKLPATACIQFFKVVERQGIVWMWAGEPEAADEKHIPTVADLDNPNLLIVDYIADLPYDQTYFIENAIDPAHVSISHDRTETNAKRENAQPLEMEIVKSSAQGIRGRYRRTWQNNATWSDMEFVAPNLVFYTFGNLGNQNASFYSGNAVYAIPLGKGRCRVLIRKYWQFLSLSEQLKPRWLKHMHQNKILEEDLPFIVGQQSQIERLGKNMQNVYLPLKTSDTFVIEYRKWLDRFGKSLPYFQGYFSSKQASDNSKCNQQPASLDRFSQHTRLCSSCEHAYRVTKRLKKTSVGMAIALATLAMVTDELASQVITISASISAIILAVVADKLKTNFECSYTRNSLPNR